MDKVYYISQCTLKTANKQFTSLKNDYEMTFNSNTVVVECQEDAGSVPCVKYDFVPINEIAEKNPDSLLGKLLSSMLVCEENNNINKYIRMEEGE